MDAKDIIHAMKYLDKRLQVKELSGSVAKTTGKGKLIYFSGNFNVVFQLQQQDKDWAFRVCHKPYGQSDKKVKLISEYLKQRSLPYFLDTFYKPKGLLINNEEFADVAWMNWISGLTLKDYLPTIINNSSKLETLASDFSTMFKELHANKISHGDLQEENIIIDENGALKLIDYDSICIPILEGEEEFVAGKSGFQHPSRITSGISSLKADYFSELIIYLSVLALAEKPSLWSKIEGEERLLFSQSDFENFENSAILQELNGLSTRIAKLIEILKIYLNQKDYAELDPFETYLLPPAIKYFSSSHKYVAKGYPLELEWNVENASQVYIKPQIGSVQSTGRITVVPEGASFTLFAEGFSEKIESTINVEIVPMPRIDCLNIPNVNIEETINLTIRPPGILDANFSTDYSFNMPEQPMMPNLFDGTRVLKIDNIKLPQLNVNVIDFSFTESINKLIKKLKKKLKKLIKKNQNF